MATAPVAEAALPARPPAWACPCGTVLAYVRGRTVTFPNGDRCGGCAFVERRCPACRRLAHLWLVPRTRAPPPSGVP